MRLEPLADGTGQYVTMRLSAAFDFVAKSLLALERYVILHPNPSETEDTIKSNSVYEKLDSIDPHTNQQRVQFQERWMNNKEYEQRTIRREEKLIESDERLLKAATARREEMNARTGYQWVFTDDPLVQRRRRAPTGILCITKHSTSLRYGAILCTALSQSTRHSVADEIT